MSAIPGFKGTVTRKVHGIGSAVDMRFTSVSFSKDDKHLSGSWSITLVEPIILYPDDRWTIKRGFAGQLWTIVDNALPGDLSGNDGVERVTRTVSGGSEGGDSITDLLTYCAPKTLVFVNQTWLSKTFPNVHLEDGILKRRINFTQYQHGDVTQRFYHKRLPDQKTKDDEFQCILGPRSHHDVGRYLCRMLGYGFYANTPDISLVDTYTVPRGTNWFDAIKRNFEIWSPNISVETINGTPYVIVADILGGNLNSQTITGAPVQRISITNAAIVETSDRKKGEGSVSRSQLIDHVIVEGRPKSNTVTQWPRDTQEYGLVEIPRMNLVPNSQKHCRIPMNTGALAAVSQMQNFTSTFGEGADEWQPYSVSHVERTDFWWTDPDEKIDPKLCREVHEVYKDGDGGGLQSRLTTWYYYGPDYIPAGRSEQEEAWTYLPGSTQKQWKTLKWHHHVVHAVDDVYKISITTEKIEELVIFTWNKNEKTKRLDPIPKTTLAKAAGDKYGGIETDENTLQSYLEMVTHHKFNTVDRVDDDTLVQTIFDFDVLAGKGNVTPQILQNPVKPDQSLRTSSEESPLLYEFHPTGATGTLIGGYGPCWHSPHNVKHDDIVDEATAQAIADRIFARRGPRDAGFEDLEITVKMPVMIPVLILGTTITLPSMPYKVNGATVTVPGGNFTLRGYSERINYTGQRNNTVKADYELTMTLRSGF